MNTCPHCKQPIRASTLMFSLCPVWITCSQCHTRLVGNWLMKIQSIVVAVMGVLFTLAVLRAESPLSHKITFLMVALLMISLPNVFITVKWGRYHLRAPSASPSPAP